VPPGPPAPPPTAPEPGTPEGEELTEIPGFDFTPEELREIQVLIGGRSDEDAKENLRTWIEELNTELDHPFGDRDDFAALLMTDPADVSLGDYLQALQELYQYKRGQGAETEEEEEPEAPTVAPGSEAAGGYTLLAPDAIQIDAKTYQFKQSDATGSTGTLSGVEEWDPEQAKASPIVAHQRLDGTIYVAEGHQRVLLAQRLAREGKPISDLPAIVYREAEGYTAQKVRRIAALMNIRHGNTTPLDIARVLREGSLTETERRSIPRAGLRGKPFRQAEDLAKLGDDAFQAVVNGEATPEYARFVGRYFTDPAEQLTAVRALGAADLPNEGQAEDFVRSLVTNEFTKAVQKNLFGEEEEAVSLAKYRAAIIDAVRKELGSQRSAFGGALRHRLELEEAGNILNADLNAQKVAAAKRLQTLLKTYAHTTGHTATAITEAARRLHAGEIKASDAVGDIIVALERDYTGETGEPAGRRPNEEGPGPDRGVPEEPAPDSEDEDADQPSLPGDVGKVRQVEVPTPEVPEPGGGGTAWDQLPA